MRKGGIWSLLTQRIILVCVVLYTCGIGPVIINGFVRSRRFGCPIVFFPSLMFFFQHLFHEFNLIDSRI